MANLRYLISDISDYNQAYIRYHSVRNRFFENVTDGFKAPQITTGARTRTPA